MAVNQIQTSLFVRSPDELRAIQSFVGGQVEFVVEGYISLNVLVRRSDSRFY